MADLALVAAASATVLLLPADATPPATFPGRNPSATARAGQSGCPSHAPMEESGRGDRSLDRRLLPRIEPFSSEPPHLIDDSPAAQGAAGEKEAAEGGTFPVAQLEGGTFPVSGGRGCGLLLSMESEVDRLRRSLEGLTVSVERPIEDIRQNVANLLGGTPTELPVWAKFEALEIDILLDELERILIQAELDLRMAQFHVNMDVTPVSCDVLPIDWAPPPDPGCILSYNGSSHSDVSGLPSSPDMDSD